MLSGLELACWLARRRSCKGLACRHLTPVRPRKGRKRKEGEKNWEPLLGLTWAQADTNHALFTSTRFCSHSRATAFIICLASHGHMRTCRCALHLYSTCFTCLLKVRLGWGFAQSRPQLVHVRHYLHLNGFLLPHLIPPNPSSLSYLPLPSIPLSVSLSLTLSSLVIPLMPCHMLAGDTRHPQGLVEIIPAI